MGDGSVALLDFGEKLLLRLRAEVLRGRDAMSPELTLRPSKKNSFKSKTTTVCLPVCLSHSVLSFPPFLSLWLVTCVSSASSAGICFCLTQMMSQNLGGLGARIPFIGHGHRCLSNVTQSFLPHTSTLPLLLTFCVTFHYFWRHHRLLKLCNELSCDTGLFLTVAQ